MSDSFTKLYGVLGFPVKHSLSPTFHNAAFSHLEINAQYLAFEVLPENLFNAISGVRSLGIQGCNVTVPHKTAVLPFLDQLTHAAKTIGAVNTMYWNESNLMGHNTDGIGFMCSLDSLSWKSHDKKVLVVGAGGAARAIIYALAESGVAKLTIVNRTHQRAIDLSKEFSTLFPNQIIDAMPLDDLIHSTFDLLVNTTTVGMDQKSTKIHLRRDGAC